MIEYWPTWLPAVAVVLKVSVPARAARVLAQDETAEGGGEVGVGLAVNLARRLRRDRQRGLGDRLVEGEVVLGPNCESPE